MTSGKIPTHVQITPTQPTDKQHAYRYYTNFIEICDKKYVNLRAQTPDYLLHSNSKMRWSETVSKPCVSSSIT